jgi:hypothetical protein
MRRTIVERSLEELPYRLRLHAVGNEDQTRAMVFTWPVVKDAGGMDHMLNGMDDARPRIVAGQVYKALGTKQARARRRRHQAHELAKGVWLDRLVAR